jgi:hypothetical protein
MMLKRLLFLLFIGLSFESYSQIDSLSLDTLRDAELRLSGLGEKMIIAKEEDERMLCGRNFLITLSRSLRIKNSFFYPFDSVKQMSIKYAPDNNFRIITWNIALNNGTYHNFGVIQMNPTYMVKIKDTSNLRNIYPLIDRSANMKNALDTVVDNNFWFGASYYHIAKYTYKKKTYYLLFGWNGATQLSNKKLVDVLTFENNKPKFGAPIFNMNEARFKKPLTRLVYEFSNRGTMTLRIPKKKPNYIIVENIVPPKAADYGKPETYLPDGSYEYFVWEKGMWNKKGPLKDYDLE